MALPDVEGKLISYGESIGPPTSWPRQTLGAWREQCDDDTILERRYHEVEGLDIGGVEIGEADVDVF